MKYWTRIRLFGGLVAVVGQLTVFAEGTTSPTPTSTTNSPPIVSIAATDAEAAEVPVNGVTNTALFTISRTGPTNDALTVYVTLGGTATFGPDYTLTPPLLLPPTTVSTGTSSANATPIYFAPIFVIPAGASNATLTVWPLNDDTTARPDASGSDTVVVRLQPSFQVYPLAAIATTNPIPPIQPNYVIDPSNAYATAVILDNDVPPTNFPPSVEIVYPSPDSTIVAPTNVPVSAVAYDRDGSIQSVEFFANGVSLGTVPGITLTNPTANASITATFIPLYSVTWNVTNAGSYTLTAKATDNQGASTTSRPVAVTVLGAPTNLPPVATITSPPSNAVFTLPASVSISATVSDSSAAIDYVAFFANDSLIGVLPGNSTNNSYAFTWKNPPAGSYNLTVTARDELRASGVSAPIPITVNPPVPIGAGHLFNLNFGGGNETGFAAIGVNTNDQWNLIPPGVAVQGTNLVMADSSRSAIVVNLYNAAGLGANNSGDPMYDSYVFPKPLIVVTNSTAVSGVTPASSSTIVNGASSVITTVLHNVPVGKYDLYLYGHADALPGLENDTMFQVAAAEQSFGPLGTVSSSGWLVTQPWVEGVQYVVIRDVSVGLEGTIRIQASPGFNGVSTSDPRHAAVLNGLQLMSVDPSASNAPPTITLVAPTNGAVFPALANITLTADAEDSDGKVSRVDFFAGTRWLGASLLGSAISSTGHLFSFTWTNVLPATYLITARATDDGGKTTVSQPVKIVVAETNSLPVVNIFATHRYAVEPSSNIVARAGTFTVTRRGDTSGPLTVFYTIGGTATNGVDYAQLDSSVTIPAGTNAAGITVTPLNDGVADGVETVVLTLIQPPVASPGATPPVTYAIGKPSRDVVYILEFFPPGPPITPAGGEPPVPSSIGATLAGDGLSGQLSVSGGNDNVAVIEVSNDLINWTYLTHGTVVNGQLSFSDADATGDHARFYRAVAP